MKNELQKWIKSIGDFKLLMSMYFTGIVAVYMIIGYGWYHKESISFTLLLQIILSAFLGASVQYLFFDSLILKNWQVKWRVLGHFLLSYAVIFVLSGIFKWFNMTDLKLTMALSGIYVLGYAIIFTSFYIYYRSQEYKLNQKLEAFKQGNKIL